MSKISCKRILGLLIFTLVLGIFYLFNPIGVRAFSCDDTDVAKEWRDKEDTRYNIETGYNRKTDSFIIYYDENVGKAPEFNGEVPALQIVSIKSYSKQLVIGDELVGKLGVGGKFVPGDTITIKRSDVNYTVGLYIHLQSYDYKNEDGGFRDPDLKAQDGCTGKFDIYRWVIADINKMPDAKPISLDIDTSTSGVQAKNTCDNYKSKFKPNDFEYKFCSDWEAAEAAGAKVEEFKTNEKFKDKFSEAKDFRCDYEVKGEAPLAFITDKDGNRKDNPNYYTNKKYMRGSSPIVYKVGDYVYHEEAGRKTEVASCTIRCEEVVTVEYGPPVAVEGGVCFDYKVKVTSRVNCDMETPPNPPKEIVICPPKPECVHTGADGSTSTYKQGGPNDSFDKCINKCDKGKYTDKCVNKCYKQVYGSSISRTTGSEISYANKVVNSKITDPDEKDIVTDTKCTYQYSGGSIVWNLAPGNSRERDGSICDSYYHIHDWDGGITGHKYNMYTPNGIPKTESCDDDCEWLPNSDPKCSDPNYAHYLNPQGVYSEIRPKYLNVKSSDAPYMVDKKRNEEKYKELVEKCQAYASCSETTAEFTISVDYSLKSDKNKKITIEYPFDTKKATIKNAGENSKSVTCLPETKQYNTKVTDKNGKESYKLTPYSILLDYDGCYECGEENRKNYYLTEWSFPGTFASDKGTEFIYNPEELRAKYYLKYPNQFCVPWKIANVNTKWYNYYQAKVNSKNEKISYNSNEEVVCKDGTTKTMKSGTCDYTKTTYSKEEAKSLKEGGITDYNIHATARNFGMYNWNIDISCFYAVNDQFPCDRDSKNSDDTKNKVDPCGEDLEPEVRPVDLKNLFPDDEGTVPTDPSKTSRTPGFNWTKYAEQVVKDSNYKSSPQNYLVAVQKLNTGVYNEQYLDYEVVLTKESISRVKNEVSGFSKKYNEWPGKTNLEDGDNNFSVVNYKSTLLRGSGGTGGVATVYPGENALKCNNIGKHVKGANYNAECADVTSGEVE